MTALKPKVPSKPQREKEVLLGIIENFIESGKPVGSNTLKGAGFEHLSSATIRNYSAKLEEEGYLEQAHASGGRTPTAKAFRFYANEYQDNGVIESTTLDEIEKIKTAETKEISALIRTTVEELARISGMAAFISAPRFDKDFLIDIKVIPIDQNRVLLVLVTDFGSIQPEVLQVDSKLSNFAAKRIESYLKAKLTGQPKPEGMEKQEEELAQKFYNEVIVRFLVGYTNFSNEELIRTGFSNMLQYPEFRDVNILSECLALFENTTSLRHLVRDTVAHEGLRSFVGPELISFGAKSKDTSALTIPYMINNQYVGAIGLLGPTRMPYRHLFGLLRALSLALSTCLTKNLYKFKLSFRQPQPFHLLVAESKLPKIEHKQVKLIASK